ncbi:hypothetical protein [Streptomyces sp. NBC_01451]|uniref:hypothetical protein n=1 Tax=Streptomyces sp. NBC_01451 TaxID=2903872 RepID=UPI002E315338|nr:hypothetical protein [Streptomyces sp. NBC_01451]
MTNVIRSQFPAAHAAADRLDGPIGREIERTARDFEQLVDEFTHNGAVDTHSIDMMRVGLDRLEMHSKIESLADELAERARFVRRLGDELGNDKAQGAVERLQGHIDFQMGQVIDIAQNASTHTDA